MADEFDITVKHPDFTAYEAAWACVRDAIDGADAIKAKGQKYLPMKSGIKALTAEKKKDAAYDAYKSRAEFPEIVSPTVQGVVGLILGKPTDIKLPSGMEDLREKATQDGLTLEGLHQRITMEVMRMGRYGLIPGVDEAGEFHIAGYTAETICNWDAPDGDLNFLVLDETGPARDHGTNKWETDKRLRECYLDEAGIYTSREWIPVVRADGKDEWYPEEVISSKRKNGEGLDVVPFVAVGSTDLTLAPDDIPLYGLAKLALRAYQLDADYVNALHMTSEPTPYVTGVDKDAAPMTIGAGQLWVLPAEGATAGMLEFTGAGLSAQEKAIENTLKRAIIFGAQLFADKSRAAESGEALKLRLGSQQAVVKSVAMVVAAGLEKALRHIAKWGGMNPDEVVVTPNLDFVDHRLSPQEILALVSSWQRGAFSKQTLHANLQRGEITPADRNFEDEEELIEEQGPPLAGLVAE